MGSIKTYSLLQGLYVGSTLKFSLEQRHNLISTTFQRCSNVRCPLGSFCFELNAPHKGTDTQKKNHRIIAAIFAATMS